MRSIFREFFAILRTVTVHSVVNAPTESKGRYVSTWGAHAMIHYVAHGWMARERRGSHCDNDVAIYPDWIGVLKNLLLQIMQKAGNF